MSANLYIQTAFLGDLCLAVPTLKRIKLLRPHSPLILVCRQGFGSLMRGLELVDEVYEVEKGNSESYQEVLEKISKIEFEWVFCPHESFTSAWFQKGIKAKRKVAFRKWWNAIFFTETLTKRQSLPEALRQMSLLTAVDQELELSLKKILSDSLSQQPSSSLPAVPAWASPIVSGLSVETQQLVEKKFSLGNGIAPKRAVIFPGSVWQTKKWTESGFSTVARFLEGQGLQVVFLGSKEERELCERLRLGSKSGINLAGQASLLESLFVLAGSSLVVSNDSGGQHLASLVGVPSLTIFGPTILAQGFRPWNSKAMVAEVENLSCRPCGKHGHKKCPLGTHDCMKRLSPELVQQKALQLLTQYSL